MGKTEFVFGIRAVIEAINSGKEVEKVLLKRGAGGELYQELFELVRKKNIQFQMVPIEKLNRMTRANHQGAIAMLSQITYQDLPTVLDEVLAEGDTPLFLILDRVSDVRNFGAIARSAEVAGVHAIIVPEAGSAQINADAIKTSAGALHSIPVCRVKHLKDAIFLLQQSGVTVVASSEKADALYYNTDMTVPLAVVMGAEDKGISAGVLKIVDKMIKIPQLGVIDSLNVSVAASLMIFEAVRQRDPMKM